MSNLSPSMWADIRGKGLGRIQHFIAWYCGTELARWTVGGWRWIPTGPDEHHITRMVIERKAHGFVTIKNRLFAIYWWGEGENWDVPTFEFQGEMGPEFNRIQGERFEEALADQEAPITQDDGWE